MVPMIPPTQPPTAPALLANPPENRAMTSAPSIPQLSPQPLPADEVLRVARKDAERVYKDLERFRISLFLEPDGWHIEYVLTEPFVAGGGPHYLIDPKTGMILSKTYYQ